MSKRDGAKLGIPVFPLSWPGNNEEESFAGFEEFGFEPAAVLNFLAFLGWNPGTEQEIFSLNELCKAFSIEKIGKAGARFDFEKAKWFNQQYIMAMPVEELADRVIRVLHNNGHSPERDFLLQYCGLMKERVVFYPDFYHKGYYFFEPVREYDEKTLRKKWKPESKAILNKLIEKLKSIEDFNAEELEGIVKQFIETEELKFGDVLPLLRIALSGTTKGPDLFGMMALMGKEVVVQRIGMMYEQNDLQL